MKNIELDIACERLRVAMQWRKVTTTSEQIKKRWAQMSLVSSNKKRGNYARGL